MQRSLLGAVLVLVALGGCGSCEDADRALTTDAGRALAAHLTVNPWTVRSEETLAIALGDAQAEAARLDKRVLLVFVAFGDPDSEAVVRALSAPPVQAVLAQRYVPVFANLGRDGLGQTRLRHAHDVRELATLVVLESSGHRLARQTFSPVTDARPLSSAKLAEWLSAPHGR